MKKLVIGLMFVVVGVFSVHYFSNMEKDDDDYMTLKINQAYDEQLLENRVRGMVNSAKSNADLAKAEVAMQELPKEYQERITPTITFKRAAFLFNEAEDHLRKAIEIENAVAVPNQGPLPPPEPDPENPDHQPEQIPPPQRELHPLTLVNLNKAMVLYEKARKEAEKLKDIGNPNFDYHMNYLKGEIYYRILELMADPDSAQELFNQTLTYYKYALRSRNRDVNTVVNIEILIKNQSSLLANANDPQARKKQALSSKKYGVGRSTGN
jgi:tetratricopeptide (TPR) repeat protein